eukprot:Ihof_evm4s58 gene=Ihof_evmTU4s58
MAETTPASAIDICGDGGLLKTILKEGAGDEKPQKGDTVSVHYVGTLLDGTEFDSSRKRNEPFTFKLGQGQVIKGWDKGLASMTKGEHAVLQCREDYAYGKAGSPPTIPADATLNFDVELISWTSGEDLSGDGGVVGKIVKEGDGWKNPKDEEMCVISYKGINEKGETFVEEKEMQYKMGSKSAPKGIEQALRKMKKGAVMKVHCASSYGYGEKGLAPHVEPNAYVDFEVELHSWKEVTKVGDSGIKKIKLMDGEGYTTPNKFATVTVAVSEGETLGETQPKSVQLCCGQLPEGVEAAILMMHKGETSQIVVAPSHQDPDVETISTEDRSYVVNLVDFKKEKEIYEMDTAERLKKAEELKASGTVLFKEGKYTTAVKHYEQSDKTVDTETGFDKPEEKDQKNALLLAARLNVAACTLKLKKYQQCIEVCDKILKTHENNVKALYRKGCALNATKKMEEAKVILQ